MVFSLVDSDSEIAANDTSVINVSKEELIELS